MASSSSDLIQKNTQKDSRAPSVSRSFELLCCARASAFTALLVRVGALRLLILGRAHPGWPVHCCCGLQPPGSTYHSGRERVFLGGRRKCGGISRRRSVECLSTSLSAIDVRECSSEHGCSQFYRTSCAADHAHLPSLTVAHSQQ